MADTRMTFADAAKYQDSFDAVEAGTATYAEAMEVEAVMAGLDHLRDIGNRAGRIVDARINLLADLPAEKHEAVVAAIDAGAAPRIILDRDKLLILTLEEAAAAAADAQAIKP